MSKVISRRVGEETRMSAERRRNKPRVGNPKRKAKAKATPRRAKAKAKPGRRAPKAKAARRRVKKKALKHRKLFRVHKLSPPPRHGRTLAVVFYLLVLLPLCYYLTLGGTNLSLAKAQAIAGETVVVRLERVSPWLEFELTGDNYHSVFYRDGFFSRLAMMPLPAGTKVGARQLQIKESNGFFRRQWQLAFSVPEYEEKLQELSMPGKKMALWKRKRIKQEREELRMILRQGADGPFIRGRFVLPLKGRISTIYGIKRRLNRTIDYGYHRGFDIAAPEGEPVRSANSGWVVYSKANTVGGDTIVIEGFVEDDTYIDTLTIGGIHSEVGEDGAFHEELHEEESADVLTLVARDVSGKETHKHVVIHDTEPPVLTIEQQEVVVAAE